MIGADGGRMVADALGIKLQGDRDIVDMVSAHIRAPISQHHPDLRVSSPGSSTLLGAGVSGPGTSTTSGRTTR